MDRSSALTPARELLGFRLGDAAVDVRGWPVIACDGRQAGTVDRLIVDLRSRRVRYLGVALKLGPDRRPNVGGPGGAGTVLIPVGLARRHDDTYVVTLERLTTAMLAHAPRIAPRPIQRDDEDATLSAYGLPTSEETRDLYAAEHFDDTPLFAPVAAPEHPLGERNGNGAAHHSGRR